MDAQFCCIIMLACSPLLAFILHILAARSLRYLNPNTPPLLVAAFAILVGCIIMGILVWQSYLRFVTTATERFWGAGYGILVYSDLSFSYFIFFAMTESARRIRILQELYLRGKMTLGELRVTYVTTEMVSVRLERMVALKQLRRLGDRYLLEGPLLYCVGRIMFFWSKLLGFSKREVP